MRAVSAAALSLFLLLICSSGVSARQEAESSTTPAPVFEFHSGFWVNLHHFLYLQGRILRARVEAAQSETQTPPAYKSAASTEGLTADQRRAWDEAVQTY